VLQEPVRLPELPPGLDLARQRVGRLPWPLRPSFEECELA